MDAREEILKRVRRASADVTITDPALDVPIEWVYGQPTALDDVLATFEENILDYRAGFVRTGAADLPTVIVDQLRARGVDSVVVPDGLDPSWVAAIAQAGITVTVDHPGLGADQLDLIGGVVTASSVALAETGTICLEHGPDQGRRAISLMPDVHVCVVRADQVVSDVPEGMARLEPALRERRPVTWISGGSATSDIELSRVEGVHGPRLLHVVLVD